MGTRASRPANEICYATGMRAGTPAYRQGSPNVSETSVDASLACAVPRCFMHEWAMSYKAWRLCPTYFPFGSRYFGRKLAHLTVREPSLSGGTGRRRGFALLGPMQ